jgi:hypothetical protein
MTGSMLPVTSVNCLMSAVIAGGRWLEAGGRF